MGKGLLWAAVAVVVFGVIFSLGYSAGQTLNASTCELTPDQVITTVDPTEVDHG